VYVCVRVMRGLLRIAIDDVGVPQPKEVRVFVCVLMGLLMCMCVYVCVDGLLRVAIDDVGVPHPQEVCVCV